MLDINPVSKTLVFSHLSLKLWGTKKEFVRRLSQPSVLFPLHLYVFTMGSNGYQLISGMSPHNPSGYIQQVPAFPVFFSGRTLYAEMQKVIINKRE